MQILTCDDYAALSRKAARMISETIKGKPTASLIVATGNTPMRTYEELAKLYREGEFDTGQLRVFQLDEYLGVPSGDPRSLYDWMVRSFLEPLDISEDRCVRLYGDTSDIEATCQAYDAALQEVGAVDIVILGLGPNGHLGFNEPPTAVDAPTRRVSLTEESIQSNAAYWGGRERVPQQALTCGMSHLLAGRQVFLLVSGEHKRQILQSTVEGPVTPQVPASYLQQVENAVVIADQAAWPN